MPITSVEQALVCTVHLAKQGMWRGEFALPWDYRKDKRAGALPSLELSDTEVYEP